MGLDIQKLSASSYGRLIPKNEPPLAIDRGSITSLYAIKQETAIMPLPVVEPALFRLPACRAPTTLTTIFQNYRNNNSRTAQLTIYSTCRILRLVSKNSNVRTDRQIFFPTGIRGVSLNVYDIAATNCTERLYRHT